MPILDSESLLTFPKNVAGDLFANLKVAIYTFLKCLILILNDRQFRARLHETRSDLKSV